MKDKEKVALIRTYTRSAEAKMLAAKQSVEPLRNEKLTAREEMIFDALNLMTEGFGFALKAIETSLDVIIGFIARGKQK